MFVANVNSRTTRLATVSRMDGGIQLLNRAQFNTADFDGFESILQRYFRDHEAQGGTMYIAVPGPLSGNEVSTHHLPWPINGESVAERMSFGGVSLIDEYLAAARGILELPSDKLFSINDAARQRPGNVGVMTVERNLAEALMIHNEGRYTTFVTNGGHTGFGPSTQLEVDLWQYLYSRKDTVEVGDVISERGLLTIYEFFLETRGLPTPEWFESDPDRVSRLIELSLSGRDDIAVEAVDLFVDCYGGEAANLALRGVTTGGLFLAGRIVSELMPALDQGRFMDNFVRRGAIEDTLAATPIHVVMDREAALLGAACLALESQV